MRATSALLIIFRDEVALTDPAVFGGQDHGAGGVVDADGLQLDAGHHERELAERRAGDDRAVRVRPQSPLPYVVDTHIAMAGRFRSRA